MYAPLFALYFFDLSLSRDALDPEGTCERCAQDDGHRRGQTLRSVASQWVVASCWIGVPWGTTLTRLGS